MQLDREYYSCLQRSGAAASLTLAELTLALSLLAGCCKPLSIIIIIIK
jgi:hypothetical protein